LARLSFRKQNPPLAGCLVALNVQAAGFPPLVEREGGLKARQRRAALVPCRDEFVASRLQYLDQANRLVGPSPASLASTASRSEGARSIPWARLDGPRNESPNGLLPLATQLGSTGQD
jgi:hypothetical protein